MEQKQLDEMEESFFEEFVDDDPLASANLDPLEQKVEADVKPSGSGEAGSEEVRKEKKVSAKSAAKKSEKKASSKKETAKKEAEVKEGPKKKVEKEEVEIRPVKEAAKKTSEVKSEVKEPVDPWGKEKEGPDMFKEVSTWKAITGVAVLLLVISLFTQGFNFSGDSTLTGASVAALSLQEAEDEVVDYVNNYLLQPPFSAEVESSVELDNLYKVTLNVAGQVVDSYLTKDGQLFFPQGFEVANAEQDFAAPQEQANLEVSADDDPVLGDENAPVTIVEFSDFQCPFCAKFFSETFSLLKEDYIGTGKVKLVFRDFPLPIHAEAEPAALAAECADEQGAFWDYHDYLFENQEDLNDANYKKWAEELGLDTSKFNNCLDSQKYLSEVQADLSDGQSYGVTGTPAFFVNGRLIKGAQPYEVLKQEIEAALAVSSGTYEEPDTKMDEVEEQPEENPVVEEVITIPLQAKKWVFGPDHLDANQGETLRLTILPQDLDFTFAIPELGVEKEVSGLTTVEFVASKKGTFEFECSSCEDWRGMTGTLTVN